MQQCAPKVVFADDWVFEPAILVPDIFDESPLKSVPFTLPTDGRPQSWDASYASSSGTKVDLATIFAVSGTMGTGAEVVTAEAVWVGIGAEPDFIGRDVKGKAVMIYSTFVPGGRSHSASDRAGLFDANTRAEKLGAAYFTPALSASVPGKRPHHCLLTVSR
jgi:hypothetical protein